MRQLVYISSLRSAARSEGLVPTILAVSRRNNARNGVSGLLFFNGKRFLQAIEGEARAIAATFARIERDDRHYAMVVLSDREIAVREFGDWAMAHKTIADAGPDAMDRIRRLTAGAEPTVRATFESYAELAAQ